MATEAKEHEPQEILDNYKYEIALREIANLFYTPGVETKSTMLIALEEAMKLFVNSYPSTIQRKDLYNWIAMYREGHEYSYDYHNHNAHSSIRNVNKYKLYIIIDDDKRLVKNLDEMKDACSIKLNILCPTRETRLQLLDSLFTWNHDEAHSNCISKLCETLTSQEIEGAIKLACVTLDIFSFSSKMMNPAHRFSPTNVAVTVSTDNTRRGSDNNSNNSTIV